MMARKLLVVFIIFLLWGCTKDKEPVPANEEITKLLDSLGITYKQDSSGIFYSYEKENTSGNRPDAGKVVNIFYQLKTLDGKVISGHQQQSSNSIALQMKIGANAIFPIGLDDAIQLMRTGETVDFYLPAKKAYGGIKTSVLNTAIPYHIKVQLVSIQDESSIFSTQNQVVIEYLQQIDSSKYKKIEQLSGNGIFSLNKKEGTGNVATSNDTISFTYGSKLFNNSKAVGKGAFNYVIGSDKPRPLLKSLSTVLAEMKKGEEREIILLSKEAYRESVFFMPSPIGNDLVESKIIPDYSVQVKPYQILTFDLKRTK